MSSEVSYRDISGLAGYRIGDDGSIWSCYERGGKRRRLPTSTWHRLDPILHKKGYLRISLYSGGRQHIRSIHRLVLTIFRVPALPGQQCRHKGGNPANNR